MLVSLVLKADDGQQSLVALSIAQDEFEFMATCGRYLGTEAAVSVGLHPCQRPRLEVLDQHQPLWLGSAGRASYGGEAAGIRNGRLERPDSCTWVALSAGVTATKLGFVLVNARLSDVKLLTAWMLAGCLFVF